MVEVLGGISPAFGVQNIVSKTARQTCDVQKNIVDEYELSDEAKKFEDIVKKYDISAMSHKEMCSMCHELYQNGLMSGEEMMMMTFDYDKAIESIAKETGSPINDISIGGRKYQGGGENKIDYKKYLENAIKLAQKMGDEGPIKDLAIIDKIAFYQNAS